MVTITKVEVTRDFSYADIYVSAYPQNENIIKYLSSRISYYQSILNKRLKRKVVPMIRFHYDKV